MSFKTTPEHELFRSKVRELAETEVKPIAFMLDQENQFPDEIVSHMTVKKHPLTLWLIVSSNL